MSQFFQGTTAGDLPPSVPLTFTTDSGTAIPVANNLNVYGSTTPDSVDNGIQTSGSGANVTISLTNRFTSNFTTTDGLPHIIAFPLQSSVKSTYIFNIELVGVDTTLGQGASYSVTAATYSDGTTAFLIGSQTSNVYEQAGMNGCEVDVSVQDNLAIFQVFGLAGSTIKWKLLFTYRKVTE